AQALTCVRGLIQLVDRKALDAQAARHEVEEVLDASGIMLELAAIRGRLDTLCGDASAGEARYRTALVNEGMLPKWLREAMHLDLARAAFARREDAVAIEFGRKAGELGEGGILIAAAAALRAGRPDPRGLRWVARFGQKRTEAWVLLAHSLIDLG